MNFKYWKFLFMMMMVMSMMISISSFSWFGMWIGLEINMMSIIPLMSSKNILNTESTMKYFITQSIAATIIITMIIMFSNYYSNITIMILNFALLMKLGSAPTHFWFPEVMEGQSWFMCFMLLTIQKITPFMILSYNLNSTLFFMIIITLNMIISMMMGLNQISMRKIMTFSSINHIGWMMSSIMMNKNVWMIYMTIYILMTLNLIYILNNMKIFYFNQFFTIKLNFNNKLMIILVFFSMMGLPPFIGFFPKWLVIQLLMLNSNFIIISIMIMLTLFTMFYYLRIMITTLMFMSYNNTNFTMNKNYWLVNSMTIFLLPIITMILY
uniref:NADH-ubiquinone oxidoreductase chain 2 n=1 Tax=Staphylinidae sp. BMNH 1274668 TaxID=1796590 RepID=A0A140EFY0_9COLE|nr:NADH dehydrogenase subunit 2 [Staphylinidae sp. BMNH 1274668]